MMVVIVAMAVLGVLFFVMAFFGAADRRPRQRDDDQ